MPLSTDTAMLGALTLKMSRQPVLTEYDRPITGLLRPLAPAKLG
jgi:hypothetical protein